MKKGFTLVELSIVLVIIGLLLGGILVGQSLIGSAGNQSLVRQIQQIDIAANLFREKFGDLPGDSTAFPNDGDSDDAGDGDGVLEDVSNWIWNGEMTHFWRHLSQSGFKPDGVIYSNDGSSGLQTGVHFPKAAFTGAASNTGVGLGFVAGWNSSPYYYLCDYTRVTTTNYVHVNTDPAYTPAQALAFDAKIDDGVLRVADMVNYEGDVSSFVTGQYDCYDGSFRAKVENDNAGCCLRVRIGLMAD